MVVEGIGQPTAHVVIDSSCCCPVSSWELLVVMMAHRGRVSGLSHHCSGILVEDATTADVGARCWLLPASRCPRPSG